MDRTPVAPVAPVAATAKLSCPADKADMPTTTFQPADAFPATTKRPSFGVTVGVTPDGTLPMADTKVPAAAFAEIEGVVGDRERTGAAADTVRVNVDDEAVPPVPVANSWYVSVPAEVGAAVSPVLMTEPLSDQARDVIAPLLTAPGVAV